MKPSPHPLALVAKEVPPNKVRSILPAAFAARMQGRDKRRLGELFGLTNFGVNLTRIEPGGMSSLLHEHDKRDEFLFILEGHPTLHTSEGSVRLSPGMCAGFQAGGGRAHHLLNETETEVWYLEIGDRSPGDAVTYPEEDLAGALVDGAWRFTRKDGTPY